MSTGTGTVTASDNASATSATRLTPSTVTFNTGNRTPKERFDRALVEEVVGDMHATLRKDIQRDIQNMHLDMIRQFEDQQEAMSAMLDQYVETCVRARYGFACVCVYTVYTVCTV